MEREREREREGRSHGFTFILHVDVSFKGSCRPPISLNIYIRMDGRVEEVKPCALSIFLFLSLSLPLPVFQKPEMGFHPLFLTLPFNLHYYQNHHNLSFVGLLNLSRNPPFPSSFFFSFIFFSFSHHERM